MLRGETVVTLVGETSTEGFLVYDTIRYDIDLRALKSWRDGQLNLAHGPETKNNEKIKIKTE